MQLSVGEDGDYHLAVGTAEFGNGTTTLHAQVVASLLGTTVSRVRMVQADTDRTGYDTGAFASTGTTVPVSAPSAARSGAGAPRRHGRST